jgi:hypothetical protein
VFDSFYPVDGEQGRSYLGSLPSPAPSTAKLHSNHDSLSESTKLPSFKELESFNIFPPSPPLGMRPHCDSGLTVKIPLVYLTRSGVRVERKSCTKIWNKVPFHFRCNGITIATSKVNLITDHFLSRIISSPVSRLMPCTEPLTYRLLLTEYRASPDRGDLVDPTRNMSNAHDDGLKKLTAITHAITLVATKHMVP